MKIHNVLKNALTKAQYKLLKKEIVKQRGVSKLKSLNKPYNKDSSIRGLLVFKNTKKRT